MDGKWAKFTDYWKTLNLELDPYFPADPIAVYRSPSPEEAHIGLLNCLAYLDGERDVAIINPLAPAEVLETIKKEMPQAEIICDPLIRKDQILLTKKKYINPPAKWW